ncbi:hypothetical protein KP509_04G003700 [Ceratopteris richardii]|nr:hypothetical protein KP509_04G003700 [Ceratopteris richardii]
MQNRICVESMMHLTCTNMPVDKLDKVLDGMKANGIQNILALRGDPPHGQDKFVHVSGGFSCALDLVKHIRHHYGDYFGITVAGYPEAHPEVITSDKGATQEAYYKDLLYLKSKVDAGADVIITQLFYDTDLFLKFYNDCRKLGITCPIVPGIMPINNYKGFKRMTGFCKTKIPAEVTNALEPIKDDNKAVIAYGIQLGTEMCKKLLAHGIKHLHIYTLNLDKSAVGILQNLGIIDTSKVRRPLPAWRLPANINQVKEDVRPIFWVNQPRNYISRTVSWKDFPHGKLGHSRSPAYGAYTDYQFLHKRSHNKEIQEDWVVPLNDVQDIYELFAKYCSGKRKGHPWSELEGLRPETDKINAKLVEINTRAFLTTNIQPAVNGQRLDSSIFGWGGPGGYVYQKAYAGFFCAPENLDKLVENAKGLPNLTYIAANLRGKTRANIGPHDVNHVTWGVFPAKETVQLTVVDPVSFMALKDETFHTWNAGWGSLYAEDDSSRRVIQKNDFLWQREPSIDASKESWVLEFASRLGFLKHNKKIFLKNSLHGSRYAIQMGAMASIIITWEL